MTSILLKKFQNNLTIFKFGIDYDNYDWIIEVNDILRDILLTNLQELIIYNDCPLNIIEEIIKKTNGQLKKVSIGTSNIFDEYGEICYIITSAIATNCPKLELKNVKM